MNFVTACIAAVVVVLVAYQAFVWLVRWADAEIEEDYAEFREREEDRRLALERGTDG